jgi:uncharacterized membrane protein YoaK (UPF0700 family)
MPMKFLDELRQTIVPGRDGPHGPLPTLLVALTVVTGLVDAFSYLALGHVFVANMTGNVVFLGFALAGAAGFSIPASLAALAAFVAGALGGGRIASRFGHHRGHLLAYTSALQVGLFAIAVLLAALSGDPVPAGYRYSLIVVLGAAMGIQNAGVRRLGVPDLTTTVLTLTITGIAADSTVVGGSGSMAGRRAVAVAAMLLGALVGALLVIHVHIVAPLAIALFVMAIVTGTSWATGASDPPWVRAGH